MKILMYQHKSGGQITLCCDGYEKQQYMASLNKQLIGCIETEKTPMQILAGMAYSETERNIKLENLYSDIVCAVAKADNDTEKLTKQRKRKEQANRQNRQRLYGTDKIKDIDKED